MGPGSAAERRGGAACGSPSRDPEGQLCVRVSKPRQPGRECASAGCTPARPRAGPAPVPCPSPSWLCARAHTQTHTHTHPVGTVRTHTHTYTLSLSLSLSLSLCWDCACHLIDSVRKGIPFSLPSQSVGRHMESLGQCGPLLTGSQVSSRSPQPLGCREQWREAGLRCPEGETCGHLAAHSLVLCPLVS